MFQDRFFCEGREATLHRLSCTVGFCMYSLYVQQLLTSLRFKQSEGDACRGLLSFSTVFQATAMTVDCSSWCHSQVRLRLLRKSSGVGSMRTHTHSIFEETLAVLFAKR